MAFKINLVYLCYTFFKLDFTNDNEKELRKKNSSINQWNSKAKKLILTKKLTSTKKKRFFLNIYKIFSTGKFFNIPETLICLQIIIKMILHYCI